MTPRVRELQTLGAGKVSESLTNSPCSMPLLCCTLFQHHQLIISTSRVCTPPNLGGSLPQESSSAKHKESMSNIVPLVLLCVTAHLFICSFSFTQQYLLGLHQMKQDTHSPALEQNHNYKGSLWSLSTHAEASILLSTANTRPHSIITVASLFTNEQIEG